MSRVLRLLMALSLVSCGDGTPDEQLQAPDDAHGWRCYLSDLERVCLCYGPDITPVSTEWATAECNRKCAGPMANTPACERHGGP